MERKLIGVPASPGIVVGPVHLLRWEVPEVTPRFVPTGEIASELDRFRATLRRAQERLELVRDRVERNAGVEEAKIFEAQLLLLDDPEISRRVEELIRLHHSAEEAFDITMRQTRQHFASHASPMIRERVGDIVDVHIRVLSLLMQLPDHDPVDVPKGTNAVLVTHDLTPTLTVQLDREAIAAIATDAGTRTSHVAILARSLGIPAVVGLRDATQQLVDRQRVIIDGTAGAMIVLPTDAEVEQFEERARQHEAVEAELALLASEEAVTTDGGRVVLRVNLDLPEEAEFAANSGADGVGLMRTEFLVLNRTTMPDEEEQFRAYKRVADAFVGRAVIVRTFDIGGDKLPVGGFPAEPNPFLGWRAIRMCLDEPELFKTQLRALLRAAQHGDVRILLPLVVSYDEVRRTRELLREAAEELAARRIPHRSDLRLGVMIETPAAAMAADTLVENVHFFSIGTNDLTQYTLAVDRGNANLAERFTPFHPAVMRLVRRIVEVGSEHGIEVSVCGELASQPLGAFALIGLGVRELSVGPRSVSRIKRLVRGISLAAATAAARAALGSRTAAEAEEALTRCLASACADAPVLLGGLPPLGATNIIQS